MSEYMEVSYAYQKLDNLPDGYNVPEGRVKPWGNLHMAISCTDQVNGPFAASSMRMIITREAFQLIYDYLTTHQDDDKFHMFMSSYILVILLPTMAMYLVVYVRPTISMNW